MKSSRINRSWLLSLVMAVAVAVFLMSADVTNINSSKHEAMISPNPERTIPALPSVHAKQYPQQVTHRTLTLYGRTQADRVVTVSAEIPARVVAVHSKRGELLAEGENIVQLREGSLKAELQSAKAQLKQAEQEYQSTQSLFKKNHMSENDLTIQEVVVAQAESALKQLQVQWGNTRIKAPVAGILNDRFVEVGDFIDTGKPVAEILDLDPLVITIDVPQRDVSAFSVNDKAQIRFINGKTAIATIRYINRQADSSTRTFAMELMIPNPDLSIPAGLSVEADLFMDQVAAIEISPALLTLSDKGEPGLKWVDRDNRVRFSSITIVKNSSDRLWLTGIPQHARIITRGQGFVRIGDEVQVVDAELVAGE